MLTIEVHAQLQPVVCDKVTFTLPILSQHEQCELLGRMEGQGQGWSTIPYGKGNYYAAAWVSVGASETPARLLLQASPKYSNQAFFRCEWNPAKCDPLRVIEVMDQVLPGGAASLTNTGRCTRVDFAIDVTGVRLEDLLAYQPGLQVAGTRSKCGRLVQLRIGAPTSATSFSFYEKDTETIASDGSTPAPYVRIEARLRPSCSWAQLVKGPCPFGKIQVSSVKALSALSVEDMLFLESCRFRGSQAAILKLPMDARPKKLAWLEKYSAPWWNPTALSQQRLDAMHGVFYTGPNSSHAESPIVMPASTGGHGDCSQKHVWTQTQ